MEDEKEILKDITNIKQQDTVTLPSRGLLYKAEEKIPEAITIRRMTTKEDKMRLRNESDNVVYRDILQACITTPEVNAGNLKLMDANLLLFKLRIISLLDDTYKIRLMCPACRTQFIHQLNLSEVPVKYIPQDIIKKLTVTLPVSKQVIKLKIPSLNDLIKAGEKLQEYFNKFPNVDKQEKAVTISQLLYIDTINGATFLSEELEEYVENMDILDNRQLAKAIKEFDNFNGFDDNLKTECPKCKFEIQHGLPITDELFNPSDEDITI